MKKNLFYLFALMCTMSFFVACSDDDDPTTPPDNPDGPENPVEKDLATIISEDIAGNYKGMLSVTLMPDIPFDPVYQRVTVEKGEGETVNLSITDFVFAGDINIGDIVVTGCPVVEEEDGTYSYTGETSVNAMGGMLVAENIPVKGTFTTGNPAAMTLDLDIDATLAGSSQHVLVAYDGSRLTGQEGTEAQILSFTFDNESVVQQPVIDEEAGVITFMMAEGADLTALVPTIEVSPGATVTPASGEAQDFSKEVTYTVVSEDYGVTKTYTVSVPPTVTSMSFTFEEWETIAPTESDLNQFNEYSEPMPRDVLATANEGATLLNVPSGNFSPIGYPTEIEENGYEGRAAKLITRDARKSLGAFMKAWITAGSLFTGEFDFDMGGALSPGGALKMTHFGVLYDKKPVKFKGVYKYTPGAPFIALDENGGAVETDDVDECGIQAVLYTVTSEDETLDGTNIDSDDERIVARARLEDGSAKEDWTPFELDFVWKEGVQYDAEKMYKLAIVCSSSKNGANFYGAVNSTLIIDNLEVLGD